MQVRARRYARLADWIYLRVLTGVAFHSEEGCLRGCCYDKERGEDAYKSNEALHGNLLRGV
jgi:hypothetical protein